MIKLTKKRKLEIAKKLWLAWIGSNGHYLEMMPKGIQDAWEDLVELAARELSDLKPAPRTDREQRRIAGLPPKARTLGALAASSCRLVGGKKVCT